MHLSGVHSSELRNFEIDIVISCVDSHGCPFCRDRNDAMYDWCGLLLAACVNLQALSIIIDRDEGPDADIFSHFFKPRPSFPHLRHLRLELGTHNSILHFVREHHRQVESFVFNFVDAGPFYNHDYVRRATLFSEANPMPLSPSCPQLVCPPIFVPAFLPYSNVSEVLMASHDGCTPLDADRLAPMLVKAMTQSQSSIIHISYFADSWNLSFMQLVAKELPALESLHITNATHWSIVSTEELAVSRLSSPWPLHREPTHQLWPTINPRYRYQYSKEYPRYCPHSNP